MSVRVCLWNISTIKCSKPWRWVSLFDGSHRQLCLFGWLMGLKDNRHKNRARVEWEGEFVLKMCARGLDEIGTRDFLMRSDISLILNVNTHTCTLSPSYWLGYGALGIELCCSCSNLQTLSWSKSNPVSYSFLSVCVYSNPSRKMKKL